MRIHSIFNSLDGECNGFGTQGAATTFIRCQGCNLQCAWCDTKETWDQGSLAGTKMSVDEVIRWVTKPKVTITGGEPLLQEEELVELVHCLTLMHRPVTLEINGSLNLPRDLLTPDKHREDYLRVVADYKLPSSGMMHRMIESLFGHLGPNDIIKFVVKDWEDYERAKDIIAKRPHWKARPVFSPVLDTLCRDPSETLGWASRVAIELVKDNYQLNLQLHKVLGVE